MKLSKRRSAVFSATWQSKKLRHETQGADAMTDRTPREKQFMLEAAADAWTAAAIILEYGTPPEDAAKMFRTNAGILDAQRRDLAKQ
jgi:hypothetical protein